MTFDLPGDFVHLPIGASSMQQRNPGFLSEAAACLFLDMRLSRPTLDQPID
jgi:hypothetical protein